MEAQQTLDYLYFQYHSLINVGLNIGTIRGNDFIKPMWIFVYRSLISCYIQYGLFVEFVHLFKVNFPEASTVMSYFNQACLLIFKVSVLVSKSDRMLKLIWDMNLLATSANPRELKVWVSENRRSLLISKAYVTACWIAVIYADTQPILQIIYQYFQGNEISLKLPFGGEFPFADHGIHIFILNYILTIIHIHTCLHLTIGLDSVFGWFVYAISGHFRILRIKVETAATKIEVYDNHDDFLKDVASIVRYHINILRFIDELNNIFAGILLAEVLFSCVQMCFVIYSFNNDQQFDTMAFNGLTFVVISMQMIIYCFGGEKVKNENDMLCEDIYIKFPWEKMLPSEKKMMLLPLMRSQQDVSLVGFFFQLDRNLLVYIYRTAFSFNTLLGAMKE